MASTTLLLPEPFGPTTAVMPGSNRSVVAEAKDLKPRSVRISDAQAERSWPGGLPYASSAGGLARLGKTAISLPVTLEGTGFDQPGAGTRTTGARWTPVGETCWLEPRSRLTAT